MTKPATITPAEVRAAKAAGRAAAINRQPARANPYRGDAHTTRERALAHAWARGYAAGNELFAALAAGRAAAINRQPVRANPYRGDADTTRERKLAQAWVRGYGLGNPMQIDYSS